MPRIEGAGGGRLEAKRWQGGQEGSGRKRGGGKDARRRWGEGHGRLKHIIIMTVERA